jgi:peroxiredoxin
MVQVGDSAPNFTLQGVDDFRITEFSLSDELNQSDYVILSFYVYDFSPVCTTQVCELTNLDMFEMVDDVAMWGVAPDGPYAHKQFIDEYDIAFPLLSDTAQRVAEAYDVLWEQKDGFERVPKRSLFLIDDGLTVRYRWLAGDNWDDWDNEPFRDMLDVIREIGD